jgi:hypothetical protein
LTTENSLLATLYVNLRGDKKKKEDWISIARKCKKLATKYRFRVDLAEKLGVSSELIRALMSLLDLPEEVQHLIKEGKILFDAAQRINTIETKKKQIEVARAIAGLTSHEQREIIQYAKKYPNSDLLDYKKRVVTPVNTEKIHVAIIPLREKTFKALQKEVVKNKTSLEKFILNVIEKWIEKRSKQ